MSTVNLFPKDESPEPAKPQDPSMEEILASIRKIIVDDQVLATSQTTARDKGSQSIPIGDARGAAPTHVAANNGSEASVRAAFNTLLASRFVQHSDIIVGLTREMLRPLLKSWLDENLPSIVERLVSAEIERIARGE